MATFPTGLLQLEESKLDAAQGMVIEMMANGRPNGRNLFDGEVWQGTIVLAGDGSDVNTLLSFYTTNRDLTFTFNFDGDNNVTQEPGTYTAIFTRRPMKREIGPNNFRMYVEIMAWE